MHSKIIKFQGFDGYLNDMNNYSGYGGMDWNDMFEIQSAFVNEHTDWCDTGYNNVLKGPGEAITLGNGGFQSHDLYQTFSLQGGTFASAWETKQPVTFNSYVYTPGQGFTLKASDTVNISEDAKYVNFAKFGSDFKHVSAVTMISGVGQGGNTCSYGTPTYGYILVMDNLTLKWDNNGGNAHNVPHANLTHHIMHGMPHVAANFSPLSQHADHVAAGLPLNHAGAAHDSPYHSQLFGLPGHDHGGLTSQFALPHAEHFGT